MLKVAKKVVQKKKTTSVHKNKKVVKHQKKLPIKASNIIATVEKKDEKISLLNSNQTRKSLQYLTGWQANNDNKMIYREYIMQDFGAAIDMIARIAKVSENEQHHPDIHLTQYRNLRVGTTSHEQGGLTEGDFHLASRINALPMELKHK